MTNPTLNSPEVIAWAESRDETFDPNVPEWIQKNIEAILRDHTSLFGQMGWTGIDVVTVTGWDHGEYPVETQPGDPNRLIIFLDLDVAERLSPRKFRIDIGRYIERLLGEMYAEAYIDRLALRNVADEVVVNIAADFAERLGANGPDSAMLFLEHEGRALQREFGGPKAWSPRVEPW